MDKYKTLFEKGKDAYISALEDINWFDNNFISKEKIIQEINNCSFAPYYLLTLEQLSFDSEGFEEGKDAFIDLMKLIMNFIDKANFEIQGTHEEFTIKTLVNGNSYDYKVVTNDFFFGEGENSFINQYINKILEQENFENRFYELPPADQAARYIFVKPERYNNAIEAGIIPDFLGYLAVNY